LVTGRRECAEQSGGLKKKRIFFKKKAKSALTVGSGSDYKPLTNDGGAANDAPGHLEKSNRDTTRKCRSGLCSIKPAKAV